MADAAKDFINLSKYITFLPLLLAVWKFNRFTPALRMIGVYIVLASATQSGASVAKDLWGTNLPLLHIYTPLEFSCIAWFYALLFKGHIPQKTILLIIAGFIALSVLNSLFIQDIYHFNTYARSLESILVIIATLIWFWKALEEMKIIQLDQDPIFWINTGFLLYNSGSILLFAFSNYILAFNKSLNLYVWAFHGLLNALLYVFITIGLWKVPSR